MRIAPNQIFIPSDAEARPSPKRDQEALERSRLAQQAFAQLDSDRSEPQQPQLLPAIESAPALERNQLRLQQRLNQEQSQQLDSSTTETGPASLPAAQQSKAVAVYSSLASDTQNPLSTSGIDLLI